MKNNRFSIKVKTIKLFYVIIGVLSFGLGVAGTVLPLIPTTPLILLSAVCFGKCSQRLHSWCVSTKFYSNNVENLVTKRSMTVKSKLILLSGITLIMGLSFMIMIIFQTPVPVHIILAVIWVCHMMYFGLKVKAIKTEPEDSVKFTNQINDEITA